MTDFNYFADYLKNILKYFSN